MLLISEIPFFRGFFYAIILGLYTTFVVFLHRKSVLFKINLNKR